MKRKNTRFILQKIAGLLAIVLISTFGITSWVSAEQKYYAKDGFYLGLTVPYNTIDGDFDGKTFEVGEEEINIVPDIESNFGLGITLGGRFGKGAFELSYLRSSHDATWLGANFDVDYNLVNLDGKYYFLADKPMQPYLLLGLCLPWLVVKDGSANVDGDVDDATYTGIGLNVGGGIAYYFHPQVSINAGIVYRWIGYRHLSGVSESGSLDETLNGSGLNYIVGMTFT